jgi:hypothetical protein
MCRAGRAVATEWLCPEGPWGAPQLYGDQRAPALVDAAGHGGANVRLPDGTSQRVRPRGNLVAVCCLLSAGGRACRAAMNRYVIARCMQAWHWIGKCACAQLAACLATPFTGDEKNLGELLAEDVRRSVNEVEANTQLRCAPALTLCTALLASAVLAHGGAAQPKFCHCKGHNLSVTT